MAAETTTLDPALAERERVLRILREREPELRARGVVRLRLFARWRAARPGPRAMSI
jgi:hypothetical protein